MKTLILLFLALITFIPVHYITAQPYYTEQVSGVTTSLNSVCMVGQFMPSQVWVCGNNGVVLKSTNQGSNWISVGANGIPTSVNLSAISSKANDTVLTAGNTGSVTYVYRTTNGGLSWVQVFTQSGGKINAVWMRNALSGFMTGNPVGGRWSLWKTSNGGAGWDSSGIFLAQAGSEIGWSNSLAIKYNSIWFGTNNTRLYRSTNNGTNWIAISSAPEVNSSAVWIYHDTAFYSFVMFGGNNAYFSTNNGTNWTLANCPDTGKFVGFCPGYYGVYENWPNGTYTVKNNSKIYFSGGFPNYIAEYTAPAGIYNRLSYDVEFQYSMYSFAVRSNGGITRFSLFRGGAVNRISSEIPESYSLKQNFPNPFNPTTKIQFSIPSGRNSRSQLVQIIIYDILGRIVAEVVNEQLTHGTYETEFDGSNYSSGVYYYQLASDDYSETKKMILIK